MQYCKSKFIIASSLALIITTLVVFIFHDGTTPIIMNEEGLPSLVQRGLLHLRGLKKKKKKRGKGNKSGKGKRSKADKAGKNDNVFVHDVHTVGSAYFDGSAVWDIDIFSNNNDNGEEKNMSDKENFVVTDPSLPDNPIVYDEEPKTPPQPPLNKKDVAIMRPCSKHDGEQCGEEGWIYGGYGCRDNPIEDNSCLSKKRSYQCCYNDITKQCIVKATGDPSEGKWYCGHIPENTYCGADIDYHSTSEFDDGRKIGCAAGEDAGKYSNGVSWSAHEIGRVRSKFCGPASVDNSRYGYAMRKPVTVSNLSGIEPGYDWYCKKEGCWEGGTPCGQWGGWDDFDKGHFGDSGCFYWAKKKGTLIGDGSDGGYWPGCCSGKFEVYRKSVVSRNWWYRCT